MVLFGLFNYEELILNSVLNSSFATNGLTFLLMYMSTIFLRFHVAVICGWLFQGTYFKDIILPVIINIFLSVMSSNIFNYVSTHKSSFEKITKFIKDNYSVDNIKKWKRVSLAVCCMYILFVLHFVTINNEVLLLATYQSILGFVVCEILENNWVIVSYRKIYMYIYDIIYKPKIIIHEVAKMDEKYVKSLDEIPPKPQIFISDNGKKHLIAK